MSRNSTIEPAETAERSRLEEARDQGTPWKLWGPYLSERQWGTVREDYSENGDAWNYFSHDQARSRAYHWGEDGIAGISDEKQRLCFALALWNGRDPILKERMFGLTNSEGNHGEDVKEYYFYLDSTPTHSYMKLLYKYPQAAIRTTTSSQRTRGAVAASMEYELLDTGVFSEDRYFDVFVEYAKKSPTDILIQISLCNRGPEAASVHVLPTLWFRNLWSWWPDSPKPSLQAAHNEGGRRRRGGVRGRTSATMSCTARASRRCCSRRTRRTTSGCFGSPNAGRYVKDGINDFVVAGRQDAVNPQQTGTKAAAHYQLDVGAGQTAVVRLRLTNAAPGSGGDPFGSDFEQTMELRRREADAFYHAITPAGVGEDAANVMRQALAGMLWSKQYYFFDLAKWLAEHGADPTQAGGRGRHGTANGCIW